MQGRRVTCCFFKKAKPTTQSEIAADIRELPPEAHAIEQNIPFAKAVFIISIPQEESRTFYQDPSDPRVYTVIPEDKNISEIRLSKAVTPSSTEHLPPSPLEHTPPTPPSPASKNSISSRWHLSRQMTPSSFLAPPLHRIPNKSAPPVPSNEPAVKPERPEKTLRKAESFTFRH